MANDFIQRLGGILADPNQPDWKRSAEAIVLVFEWNLSVLESSQGSRVDLLQGLSERAIALERASASFTQINNLVNKASPGPTLREALKKEQEEVGRHSSEIKSLQTEVAQLDDLERTQQALKIEFQRLQDRRKQLAYLETFDPGIVETMREQVQVVEETKAWVLNLEKLRSKLQTELPLVVRLSGDALMTLRESDRRDLSQLQDDLYAAKAQARDDSAAIERANLELETVNHEIELLVNRYQDAQKELNRRKDILAQYIQIDREIATAIKNDSAVNAQEMLNEIEKQLHRVDEVLRQAIVINQTAQATPTVYL